MLADNFWEIENLPDIESVLNDSTSSSSELPSGAYPSYEGIILDELDLPILRGEAERQRLKDMENWENNPCWPTQEPPSTKSSTDYEEELREIQSEINQECKIFQDQELQTRMDLFFVEHPISEISPEVAVEFFFTGTSELDPALASLGLANPLKDTMGPFTWGYKANKPPSHMLSPIGAKGSLEKEESHPYLGIECNTSDLHPSPVTSPGDAWMEWIKEDECNK